MEEEVDWGDAEDYGDDRLSLGGSDLDGEQDKPEREDDS